MAKKLEKRISFLSKSSIILLIVNVFLLLLFSFGQLQFFLFSYLSFNNSFCILIYGTFDWWRYEKKYQLYKYPKF